MRINGNQAFNILLLGALLWLLVWFFVSNRFYVNRVAVEGNQRVSSEAIAAASGAYGYSIFWVRPREVAQSITESLPPIRSVHVRYGLPNALHLTVEEQGKQIMWMIGDQRYWVDDEGNLHPAQGGDEPYLIVRDTRPGVLEQVDVEAVVAARQLIQLLPELKVVEYAPSTGLRFTHAQGWTVYLGKGPDMAPRVQALRTIERRFADESAEQPSVVDVRFPDNPYYR
jgi:cell division septal protein FtsQ